MRSRRHLRPCNGNKKGNQLFLKTLKTSKHEEDIVSKPLLTFPAFPCTFFSNFVFSSFPYWIHSDSPRLHKISIKFCFKCSWEDCIFLRAFENNNWGRSGGSKRKISLPSRPFRFHYGGGIWKSRSLVFVRF